MDNIQMVDLKTQYAHLKPEIDAAIAECLHSAAFINGPAVRGFQAAMEQYLGVKHVIPCANGTDALQIAMMALGLQPGDEVIVPSFTYVATAEVIALLRLVPVMVDVAADTFNITPEAVAAAITTRTRAIVPVHLFGQSADMEGIMALAKAHNLFVIEDNAQAIGADYRFADGTTAKTGTIGHLACTSFFPSKNLGCYGDGGAMMTNDDALAARLRMVANHGQSRQYYHDVVGVNSRLDSLQAAVLGIKLKHLDSYSAARQHVAATYSAAFATIPDLIVPQHSTYSTHVFHQYTLQVLNGKRDALKAYLETQKVPAMIYYPVPLYEQKAFGESQNIQHPNTEHLCRTVLSLPIHTEMAADMQAYIIDAVCRFFAQA